MLSRIIHNKMLFTVLAVAWTVLIFVGCSIPGRDLPTVGLFDHFDKVVHFSFFFVFSILWLCVYSFHTAGNKGKPLLIIIALSFLYGFALEYYQVNFVPGRSWDVWDGIADGVGGIVGVGFYVLFIYPLKD